MKSDSEKKTSLDWARASMTECRSSACLEVIRSIRPCWVRRVFWGWGDGRCRRLCSVESFHSEVEPVCERTEKSAHIRVDSWYRLDINIYVRAAKTPEINGDSVSFQKLHANEWRRPVIPANAFNQVPLPLPDNFRLPAVSRERAIDCFNFALVWQVINDN